MTGFDVLVIGGGPAGSAAAIRAAQFGHSVCLVDRARPDEFKIGESLPPAATRLLKDLRALPACGPGLAVPSFGNQSAWGGAALLGTDFIRDPAGHGWHVDRPRFDSALREIAAQAGAQIRRWTRVSWACRTSREVWRVTLKSEAKSDAGPEVVEARWIVDCGGRASSFARHQPVRRKYYDRLMAVIAEFAAGDDGAVPEADSRTLVESAPCGWWYTSLVPGRRRVVVFHSDAGSDASRLARTPDGFRSVLESTAHVQNRLRDGGYRMAGPLRVASANTTRLENFSGAGWLAAGDSAMSFDPLSSQGIFTALYSGLKAADALRDFFCGRGDAGAAYAETLGRVFQTYLGNRERYYGYERRWPESPFWRSRH